MRLALALLLGAEVVFHADHQGFMQLRMRLEHERSEIKNLADRYWMVEPHASAWVPTEFPHGKGDTRVVIAPVLVPPRKHVTVIRW
jgi:hypothetical protein